MRFTKKLILLILILAKGTYAFTAAEEISQNQTVSPQSLSDEQSTNEVSESVAELLIEDDSLSPDFEFEDLTCDQASKSKCERIKKEARFKLGQKISDKDLRNAKIRIQLLGLFKDVDLKIKKGSKKGKVIVAVETSDRSPIYTVTGVRAGLKNKYDETELSGKTSLGGAVDFTVGHRDVFGSGKNLSLSARGEGGTNDDEISSILLRYSDPNLLGSKKWFYNLELFSTQNRDENYSADNYIGSLEIGRRYGNFSYWTLGYAKGYSRINNDYNEIGYTKEGSLLIGYGYNTQDDLYFPTSGTRINLKLAPTLRREKSNSLSSYSYIIDGNFDWRTTFRLDDRVFLTWFFEGRGNQFEQDDFINNGLGFELGYQKIQNRTGSDITDLRYYIAPSITSFAMNGFGSGRLSPSIDMGVKFRSKEFGLVRLGAFWSHE